MALSTRHRLEIQILSPMHIGSGHGPLVDDLDYVRGRQIFVIDQDRLFEGLDAKKLERAAAGEKLSRLMGVGEYAGYARYALNQPGGVERVPQILDFVKTGASQPYIPGSSLKGAIRTALAWAMLKAKEIPVDKSDVGFNPRSADDPMMARLFGSDPNHDLLRVIQVADTMPVAPGEGLELVQVQLYNLMGASGQAVFRPKKDFEFFAETLRPGTVLGGELRLDEFLLTSPQARSLGFGRRAAYARDYMRHCNAFSKALIARERDFFTEQKMPEIAAFYDKLGQAASDVDESRECLMQMSWGTGWNAKTVGSVLPEELVKYAREEFRLGRTGQILFPKTRRVVIRNGKPDSVMGWVKVRISV